MNQNEEKRMFVYMTNIVETLDKMLVVLIKTQEDISEIKAGMRDKKNDSL